ncbi:DNA mismatch repair protein MutS [Geodia barretti]|uniref:DNA mismatch repair protein MutS n=1 Tax=Geodia barretti TaxID=519541 RepID=A0AA35TC34_GEOBA|nr:DNA mismatch repair protein MutS [Geodia barretti]
MTTPARRQYLRIKKEHQDAILLFRMGDFYETFDDDARVISRELEIALTSREFGAGSRVPLAGIPYHALEPYLARLIRQGYKVAICEQTSDPAKSRGLVDREVVRVVTPGTIVEETLLDGKSNNYLTAAVLDGDLAGIAYADITTGEFATTQTSAAELAVELVRLEPAELLVIDESTSVDVGRDTTVAPIGPEPFDLDWATESLQRHFKVTSLEAFGCDRLPLARKGCGRDYRLSDYHSGADIGAASHSATSMGGRTLRSWVGHPLLDLEELQKRQGAVTWFHRSGLRRERVIALLDTVSDIQRLLNRVRAFGATPRDLVSLAESLEAGPHMKGILDADDDAQAVEFISNGIRDTSEVVALIRSAIADDPPVSPGDGRVIRPGFSSDMDTTRETTLNAQQYIANLESRERERTGIKSLKVGYNKVFGYYIEVTNSNLGAVPDDYVRRQTLVGGERYITPEMKEYESRVLNAQDRMATLETELFRSVCAQVAEHTGAISETAEAIALIDVFCSLADVASMHDYVKPELSESDAIVIRQGRHPVVERVLDAGDFVPNDTELDCSESQLAIVTGPNMAGKSTFIRQVAILVLMAQIGSFVPAESASMGLVDRIFSRVGLQDDLALGQSTFMVEMVETASILNHATNRSLIILDEIGRGTSTYDGLAIARAVAEYIHSHPRLGCKTLFATHYHELTQLADSLPRARNFNVAVSEEQGRIVFLRRIVPGGADRSYVLSDLESLDTNVARAARRNAGGNHPAQLALIPMSSPALDALREIDVSSITPIEAINKLYELQERDRGAGQD